MKSGLRLLAFAVCLLGLGDISFGQVRLMAITGNQEEDDQASFPDTTLFEINLENAESTLISKLTWIPDSHAVGFNPSDGLVYHTGGSEAWTDDPEREGGWRDHQYLETYNLATSEITPIFNANPPPSPDEFPSWGDEAPRPTWVLPEEQRLLDDPSPRERGENEYHAIRHLTWSNAENLFYASDDHGIFKLTPEGDSIFVGPDPALALDFDYKGLAFYETPEGDTVLLAGVRETPDLYIIDLETGEPVDDPVELLIPPDSPYDLAFEGLLGMAQHPETGVLYGIRRTDPDAGNAFERELITINPVTGETQLIGNLGFHFTSLAFVSSGGGGLVGDFNDDGVLDTADIDDLTGQSAGGLNPPGYDLDNDSLVNEADVAVWVKDLFGSWIGDANLDGEFNSSDLIDVLATGTYEVDVDSVWSQGDFNGDGRTNSTDLVAALADGGYEMGPRAAVASVPEPGSLVLLLLGVISLIRHQGWTMAASSRIAWRMTVLSSDV
jgi:hypothetical protein